MRNSVIMRQKYNMTTFGKCWASQLCLVQQHFEGMALDKESIKDEGKRGKPTTINMLENITRKEQVWGKNY